MAERADFVKMTQIGAGESDGQGADVQHARHQAIPGRAAQDRLLPGDEEDVGRRGLGVAGEIRRPADVMSRRRVPRA